MKLLWLGDSADSGFGRVTTELCTRFVERGIDVRCINMNTGGWPARGVLAERTYDRGYFADPSVLARVLQGGFPDWKPDQAVILADFMAMRAIVNGFEKQYSALPVWHYVPIEGIDLPPLWRIAWDVVRPVAITKFGADQITKVTGRETPYIYHGVDRRIYRPATWDDPIVGMDTARNVPLLISSKDDAKRHFGLNPEDIILLRADRHMPRKNYPQLLKAVAPVLEERDDVRLVIHCRITDQGGHLPDTKSKLSPKAQEKIGFTQGHDTWRGLDQQTLATLFNAADIYLNNCPEGFGLNLAEAVACGVPVLGLDYSAIPEVIGDAGWLVPPGRLTENEYDHYWAEPDRDAYTEALRRAIDDVKYGDGTDRAAVAEQAAKFDWDVAADQFMKLFGTA